MWRYRRSGPGGGQRQGASLRWGGTAFLLFLVGLWAGALVYTEWLWFGELGFTAVFVTRVVSRLAVGAAVGLAALLFLLANVLIARRIVSRLGTVLVEYPVAQAIASRPGRRVLLLGSLVFGVACGVAASASWLPVQMFLHRASVGLAEPLFGRDIGFYLFELPLARLIRGWATFLVAVSLVAVTAVYIASGLAYFGRGKVRVYWGAEAHISVLAALLLALKAWAYRLAMFGLLYSPRGVTFGASYTDVHAQLPALRTLAFVALAGALASAGGPLVRKVRLYVPATVALAALSVILGTVYPWLVQRFSVAPNEIEKEKPYIRHNISLTRMGYGLGAVVEADFPAEDSLTPAILEKDRLMLDNIRLWDPRPLKETYVQTQGIRTYYHFADVDVDRYLLDGQYRLVLLSARELDQTRLPEMARTWLNRHLKFTHGYGLCLNGAGEVTAGGLPKLLVKDIPPEAVADLRVTEPRLYFGELTKEYVVVGTRGDEFDYPRGTENAYTRYVGTGGIPVSTPLRRAALALRLASYEMLFSTEITEASRVLFRRNIHERSARVAPFLRYDSDPYIVIGDDGRLFWIQDAYTTSSLYPYSTPSAEGFNYIRNSVKVVIDGYNGQVTYYIMDERDPLVATCARIFPTLFRTARDMPDDIRSHLRYPEFLFRVQAKMFATYHMTDPLVFYHKEDMWEFPREIYDEKEKEMEPYYIVTRLPGEEKPEFLLMLPFTPARKDNMIAWLAGRADGDRYGEMLLFRFPKRKLVYGPRQIEARIDENTEISERLTLWGQRGSRVVRGNLLVVPVNDSVVYVEPLYLEAETTKIPELKRVIVAYAGNVVMDESLESAFRRALGVQPLVGEEEKPKKEVEGVSMRDLAARARELFRRAQALAQQGDWAGYGEALRELGEALRALEEAAGRE